MKKASNFQEHVKSSSLQGNKQIGSTKGTF